MPFKRSVERSFFVDAYLLQSLLIPFFHFMNWGVPRIDAAANALATISSRARCFYISLTPRHKLNRFSFATSFW